MNETIEECIVNRAKATLSILQDIKKCKSWTMINCGYCEIEGLIGGMIKMIEREQKRRKEEK